LNVHEIDENPFQPRREFGEAEIGSLAESLREHDMLQPILVRRVDDRWQLISGERRLRAAIQAGWTQVPARVRQADDRLVAELAIVENLQRKDLNPIEKALSFQRYLKEHHCTQEDLGKRLKIDRSTIANLLRLLELPDGVQEALRRRAISAGHARALLPLGEASEQIDFCNRIRREAMSVRDTERLVQEMIRREDGDRATPGDGKTKPPRPTPSQHIAALEQELRVALGTKTEVRAGSRGRGKIVIHFSNHDEFLRLLGQLTGESPERWTRQVG
jgi:ParB family chromosome partitioning protein